MRKIQVREYLTRLLRWPLSALHWPHSQGRGTKGAQGPVVVVVVVVVVAAGLVPSGTLAGS